MAAVKTQVRGAWSTKPPGRERPPTRKPTTPGPFVAAAYQPGYVGLGVSGHQVHGQPRQHLGGVRVGQVPADGPEGGHGVHERREDRVRAVVLVTR